MSSPSFARLLLALVTLLAFAPSARAQSATPQPGDWIRVKVGDMQGGYEGRLVRVDADNMVLLTQRADTFTVPRRLVRNVWISTGQRRNTQRGMGLGLLAGASLGAVAAAATYSPCESTGFMSCFMVPASAGEAAAYGGILGGLTGFVVGTIVGVATKRHVWQDAGLPSVGVAPTGSGRLSLSVKFAR